VSVQVSLRLWQVDAAGLISLPGLFPGSSISMELQLSPALGSGSSVLVHAYCKSYFNVLFRSAVGLASLLYCTVSTFTQSVLSRAKISLLGSAKILLFLVDNLNLTYCIIWRHALLVYECFRAILNKYNAYLERLQTSLNT
jgi:hypothetical protein